MVNIADFPGLQPEFILDQLPVGLLITDANDAIIWANAEAAHLSGWPAAELRGMPLDRVIAKPELAAIARARDLGDIRALGRCHCRLLSKSAEEREVSVALVPLAAAGGPAMVVLVREIQRQREFERRMLRQLAEKQELEAYGRLVAMVMHDLRNLNNILSLTVRNFRYQIDNPAFLQEALLTLEAVARLVKYLMEKLSRPASWPLIYRHDSNMADLVRHALDMLSRAGRRDQVMATTLIGLDGCFPCHVDAAEMQRVFFNLLLNAYEAVEKGGRVTVACQSLLERKQVCLSIEDTGPGIAPSYLETSLFRPFRSTKPGGMGLGLFHAKTIIEEHGGSLDVANRTEGRGAVVTVVLPAGTAVPKMFVKEEERSCFDPRF